MSVIIPNMKMPKSCDECKAFVCYRQWAGDSGDCFCGITKIDVKEDARDADCPLVPLPEGHGRLGDLDALMKNIGDVPYKGAVRRVLMSAPTIVPAEGGTDDA